jgi:hypothetical protein
VTLGTLETVDMKERLTGWQDERIAGKKRGFGTRLRIADDGKEGRSSPKRDDDPTIFVHDRLLTSGAGLGFRRRDQVGEGRTRGGARVSVRHRLGEIVSRGRNGRQHVERRG